MKRLLDAIIAKWFCLHEWKFEQELDFYKNPDSMYPIYSKRLYSCKCGKFKIVKV